MKRFFLVVLIVLGSASLCFSSDYLPKCKEGTVKSFKIIKKNAFGSEDSSVSAKALAPRKIAGKKVYPWVFDSGTVQYTHENKIGACEFATQSPSDAEPKISENPRYFFKYPIKPGTTWQHEMKTFLLEKKIDVNCKITIESIEDTVTLPAGTFVNCLKIKYYGKRIIKKNNPYIENVFVPNEGFWVSIDAYSWYAPKIGWIKSIIKQDTDHSLVGPSAEMIYMLTEYKEP